MGLADWWYAFRMTRLSKPAAERSLFRATRQRKIESVLEVGIGDCARCQRLMEWLARQDGADCTPGDDAVGLRYAAIDMFEAGGGISLKSFHSMVTAAGGRPLPIPGDLAIGLPRVAHTIGAVDLLLLSHDIGPLTDPGVMNFVDRVIHEDSLIIVTDEEDGQLHSLSASELMDELNARAGAAVA